MFLLFAYLYWLALRHVPPRLGRATADVGARTQIASGLFYLMTLLDEGNKEDRLSMATAFLLVAFFFWMRNPGAEERLPSGLGRFWKHLSGTGAMPPPRPAPSPAPERTPPRREASQGRKSLRRPLTWGIPRTRHGPKAGREALPQVLTGTWSCRAFPLRARKSASTAEATLRQGKSRPCPNSPKWPRSPGDPRRNRPPVRSAKDRLQNQAFPARCRL